LFLSLAFVNVRMAFASTLTIGILTYNRPDAVTRLLSQIVDNAVHEYAEVVVLDDGSDDSAFLSLASSVLFTHKSIRLLRNGSNIGYASSFMRMFSECSTDYLMMMADDDLLLPENIESTIHFIDRVDPDFVSPQFILNSAVYRGKNTDGRISPSDFIVCCSHAPALIYKVASCSSGLSLLAHRLKSGFVDAIIYPQMLVVISLFHNSSRCFWFAKPLAMEVDPYPTGIKDVDGSAYTSFESRWKQLMSIDGLLLSLASTGNSATLGQMQRAHRRRAFSMIMDAMSRDSMLLRAAFDSSARQFYLKQFVKSFFRRPLA